MLRDTCGRVTGWLHHLDYEGEIAGNATFNAAARLIPIWDDTEPYLEQARNLVGQRLWDSLVTKAASKAS